MAFKTVRQPSGTPRAYSLAGPAASAQGQTRTLPPPWFLGLSSLLFLTLLLSFNHVVRQGVQSAEMRRQNDAAQTAALGRCQALAGQQQRSDCLRSHALTAAVSTADASF